MIRTQTINYEVRHDTEQELRLVYIGDCLVATCNNNEEATFVVERYQAWEQMIKRVSQSYNSHIDSGKTMTESMDLAWWQHGQSSDGTECG